VKTGRNLNEKSLLISPEERPDPSQNRLKKSSRFLCSTETVFPAHAKTPEPKLREQDT